MAGSRKWMIYTADDSTEYAVQIDESNGEISGGGFTDYTDTSTARPLPNGYKMRYVNVLEPITGTRRKITIGSVAATAFAVGGTILLQSFMPGATGTVAFDILSAIGERALNAYAGDTGLTDGDAS